MNSKPPSDNKLRHLGRSPEERRAPNESYTKFVRSMRLILPMIAVGIIGLLMSWPNVEDTFNAIPDSEVMPTKVAKNELIEPRFQSRDDHDQPFTITATRAIQSQRDPQVVLLEKPMADITLKNGTWLAAEAQKGAYRQNTERLLLEGQVKLFHDEGYEMKTEKLLVNLKTREAFSDTAVSGQGPAGTLEATGLKADSIDGTLIFTGPVKLVLNRAVEGIQ